MVGMRVTVTRRLREEARVERENEQQVLVGRPRSPERAALCRELRGEPLPRRRVVAERGPTEDAERVLVLLRGERVQRVATVAEQVLPLQRRDHEQIHLVVVGQEGTHRMEAGNAVFADGPEKRETDAELVEERAARGRHLGVGLL